MGSHKYFDDDSSNLNNIKEKEDYQKKNCKTQRENYSETDESSECEFAEVENPEFDLDFFRSLAAIRTNNPLLTEEKPLMKASYSSVSKPKEKKVEEKPFTLREFEAKVILERGGVFEDVDDTSCHPVEGGDTFGEGSFKFDDNLSPVEDDDDLFNKKNEKSEKIEENQIKRKEEIKENAAIEFLKGKRSSLPSKKDEELLKSLKKDWHKNMSKSDKILMDYFVNQRFLEEDEGGPESQVLDIVPLEEDEKVFDEMEQFETKHRFRFEEENKKVSGNRVSEKASVKKKQKKTTDKEKHFESKDEFRIKEEDEEESKSELLDKVPVGKKEDSIIDKLNQVESRKFRFQEPHGDLIRPHPRQIRESLRSTKSKRKARERERKKRVLEEKEKKKQEMLRFKASKKKEILERIERLKAEAGHNLFDGINLDDDFDPDQHDENMAKMFNKDYYEDEGANPKPVFDDEELNMELEREYKQLEALENMPEGDYKYMEVTPNSYGLTMEEILMADEEELKAWCPLSRLTQFHTTKEEELSEIAFFQKRAKRPLKARILPSLYEEKTEEQKKLEAEKRKKRNDKRKERKRRKRNVLESQNMATVNNTTEEQQTLEKSTEGEGMLNETIQKKPKNKKNLIQNGMVNEEKSSAKGGNYEEEIRKEIVAHDLGEFKKKKKKRKRKTGKNGEEETTRAKCTIVEPFVKGNVILESENERTNNYEKNKTVTDTEPVLQHGKVNRKRNRDEEDNEESMKPGKKKKNTHIQLQDGVNIATVGDDSTQEQQTQEKTIEFEKISEERIVKKKSKKKKRLLENGMENEEKTIEQGLEESRDDDKRKREGKNNSFNTENEHVAKENANVEYPHSYVETRTTTDTKPDKQSRKQKDKKRKKKRGDEPFNQLFTKKMFKGKNARFTTDKRFKSNKRNSNSGITITAVALTDSRICAYGIKPSFARYMLKRSVKSGTL